MVKVFGAIIYGDAVKVHPTKIQAMLDWPAPSRITELRGFFEITGYYIKCVQDYGVITSHLTNLLRKGKFCWDVVANVAFEKLNTTMTTTMINTMTLILPKFAILFFIQTDA